jgi:hypothetical protein
MEETWVLLVLKRPKPINGNGGESEARWSQVMVLTFLYVSEQLSSRRWIMFAFLGFRVYTIL